MCRSVRMEDGWRIACTSPVCFCFSQLVVRPKQFFNQLSSEFFVHSGSKKCLWSSGGLVPFQICFLDFSSGHPRRSMPLTAWPEYPLAVPCMILTEVWLPMTREAMCVLIRVGYGAQGFWWWTFFQQSSTVDHTETYIYAEFPWKYIIFLYAFNQQCVVVGGLCCL